MDWFNQRVKRELEQHLNLAGPGRVAVIATPGGRARFKDALHHFGGKIPVFSDPSQIGNCRVLAVIGEDIPSARTLHMSLSALKERGVAVVYCIPERRLATAPPGRENSGLQYEGMFRLASQYAPTAGRGSYVEFGVFDGRSTILAFHTLGGVCDRFFAFDSFQGIGGVLDSETTHYKDGQYYANLETFDYNLRFAGVDAARVIAVPGFFEESLRGKRPEDFGIKKATVVHIDTDVSEPALTALEFISPALPQGALLLFDDYDQLAASNDKGERRAVREWLKAHPEFEIEPYREYATFSRSFIVHRR